MMPSTLSKPATAAVAIVGLAAVLGAMAPRLRDAKACLARYEQVAHSAAVRLRLYESYVEGERDAMRRVGRWEARALHLAEEGGPERLVEIVAGGASDTMKEAERWRELRRRFLAEPRQALEEARTECPA